MRLKATTTTIESNKTAKKEVFAVNKEKKFEMKLAGIHSAVGSIDATHIVLEKCSNCLKNSHLGGKMKHAAETYNIAVNHCRQILSTTTGHPSRWNDKTLIRFDAFVSGIHEGTILNDVEFCLWVKKQ